MDENAVRTFLLWLLNGEGVTTFHEHDVEAIVQTFLEEEVGSGGCHYDYDIPYGDESFPDRFCDEEAEQGSAYCFMHKFMEE